MTTRREFIKVAGMAGAGFLLSSRLGLLRTFAASLMSGLSDPAVQPKFVNLAPNALDPGFKYVSKNKKHPFYKIDIKQSVQMTGLVGPGGFPVPTTIWGYGDRRNGVTWPGRTFEVRSGETVKVKWQNKLKERGRMLPHLLPVDTSLHWAYSLPGYERYSIARHGVPIVTHLHGGHTGYLFDGNPEYFFSPYNRVRGPRWRGNIYTYDNDQPAGNLWYHDHALGITRLNVYAGLAGFYFVRDDVDTGLAGNPPGLPRGPYELAYAIQDRMFRNTGELFYPAFPGEPFYDDFITGEGAVLPPDIFPGGGPTGLAEFFGDHIVVNGLIWPKADVEQRTYRMHLLNGCDSRFLAVRFRAIPNGANTGATDLAAAGAPLPFYVVGSDQGLAESATIVGPGNYLLINPGERYDVIFDFASLPIGTRVIMENVGGDAPFGGEVFDPLTMTPADIQYAVDEGDLFADRQTDRIMAFDVAAAASDLADNFNDPGRISGYRGNANPVARTRKVALFEGQDEFGRLQPLLGTAEPATDYLGNPVLDHHGHQIEGAVAWHMPTTENPALGTTEIWEVYNATEDAHPVHLHLVHFEVLDRQDFTADLVPQPVIQYNGAEGNGYRLQNITKHGSVTAATGVEKAFKDMVTAYPDQVTRIKVTFDKPGHYVWHCHILSHEDHEMMRVLHVGPGA